MNDTPLTNAKVKLTGTDGNSFAIIGKVSQAIKRSNHPELVKEFQKEAMSGDYNNVLITCMKYVEVS